MDELGNGAGNQTRQRHRLVALAIAGETCGSGIGPEDIALARALDAAWERLALDLLPFGISSMFCSRRWQRDDALGFSSGVSIPVFLHDGRPCGGVGVCAGNCSAGDFEAIWTRDAAHICSLVTAFDRDYRLALAKHTFPLSGRERDVLSLAAGGLTSDQMAHRLGLSRKTVEAYLVSARKKMHAPNTTAAAAKAVFFNLL